MLVPELSSRIYSQYTVETLVTPSWNYYVDNTKSFPKKKKHFYCILIIITKPWSVKQLFYILYNEPLRPLPYKPDFQHNLERTFFKNITGKGERVSSTDPHIFCFSTMWFFTLQR